MYWLTKTVDDLVQRVPDGEIVVSSGVSPSGTYHLGTLREVLTAEALYRELKRRGRQARHIHVVDDLDVFRKVPTGVPPEYEKYLGMPLCDVPAPDGSERSYADYYLQDLLDAAKGLGLEMEIMRAHQKYREGWFADAIERSLEHVDTIRKVLEEVSGRKLGEEWSPVQIIEDGYLKTRKFNSINTADKTIEYKGLEGPKTVSYTGGEVKLNWRIDWPARWWKLGVTAEPFGRDHATKGGSYDTGTHIVKVVFGAEAPLPLPYNFINRTGDTKKMSKSAGDTVTAADLLKLLPAEIVWFFVLRYAPDKLLNFDEGPTLMRLVDEYAELTAKPEKTQDEQDQLAICSGSDQSGRTVSRIPFTHLVASYQAALRDADKTIAIIARTEHAETVKEDEQIIKEELKYIDNWLDHSAPDDVRFELRKDAPTDLSDKEKEFITGLAAKIAEAPADADGQWFHLAIYEYKDSLGFQPKELFQTLYKTLIGKDSGPRAGWFLSILPRDWLVKRLKLEA